MGLKEVIETVDVEVERARHADTKAELRHAQQVIREQEGELARLREIARLRQEDMAPPGWLSPRKFADDNLAIACSFLSDLHLDEVVRPEEMHWRNAYNRDIALYRLERFFTGTVKVAKHYIGGVHYEGAVVPIGGDLVSGAIHEELRETNAAPVLATVRFWYPRIAEGLRYLADEFGQVYAPCVPGNHGRQTRKPRAKLSALDNADWLLCSLVQDAVADDDRITVDVPESLDIEFKVYGTRFLMNHGEAGGGSGIGGIWPPIMRLRAKKLQNFDFDWFICGHWHQYVHGQGLTINGSLKGYDEYAQRQAFAAERPQQALWLVTPENGVTVAAPVFCGGNPKAEGWRKRRG